MKVIFAIPSRDGAIRTNCFLSMLVVQRLMEREGIDHDVHTLPDCPYLSVVRNTLAAWFLSDPEATDHFFIDADVGFDEAKVLEILKRPEGIVCGVYPLKQDELAFPVQIRKQDGVPLGRDGLIEGELLPTGFMRIKRGVYEAMAKRYPELKYDESIVVVVDRDGRRELPEAHDFFCFGAYGRRFKTEDYAFCQRWRDMGGTLWVYPDVDFTHAGTKYYKGNYHEHLMRLPGGAKDIARIAAADAIPGWMKSEELLWLACEAETHQAIVELGSHLGRSTRALADNTSGTVWAIDDWNGPRDAEFRVEIDRDGLYDQFRANLSDHIDSGRVCPIQADHADVTSFPSVRPDMVFLDGSHEYADVKRDVIYWRERLKAGGLLCGHDAQWKGVSRALEEELPQAQRVKDTALWLWRKPKEETWCS